MISDHIDFIDMDTQEKIRYVSESSNASTSGYSTMSPGGAALGNNSPGSSTFSMPPSPAQSPATALQNEFSNMNMPSNTSHYTVLNNTPLAYTVANPGAGYMNFTSAVPKMPQTQQQTWPQQLQHANTHIKEEYMQQDNLKQEYTATLNIIEHPVEKFRFRYKSEMHGTHGSLNGANSKRTPKTFPEVELCNYNGHAKIRCSLFQTNLESPHSHQLVVRRDDADICDPHELDVSPDRGYVAQFQNMGIIHTAKKFIFEELLKKKKNRLRFELGRHELSTKQNQELHKETEKEAKDMNLNQVRLCFEAFRVEDNNTWTRIAAPVFTNAINNRKSAQTGELRICRLSIVTGCVNGGDDLILLVEKVSKKNIKVRFYELDEDDDVIWENFGRFRESDVHHQYAIVCQTPPYKNKDIVKPVEVWVELVRPSDDERSSPPVLFRYKPSDAVVSRKRRRTCSTTTSSNNSGSSLSSFELPKSVQEQTTVGVGNHTLMAAPNNIPVTMLQAGKNHPTISEEFNKEQELMNLINSVSNSASFRSIINSNSEELSQLCTQNISEIMKSFDEFPSVTQMDFTRTDGRLEVDGTSSSSSLLGGTRPFNTNSLEYKRRMLVKLLQSAVVRGGDNISPLQRMFKIYENTRNDKDPIAYNLAAKEVAEIFAEHAEREHGDSMIHEIVLNDNPKMGIKICQILSYFKLNDLVNRTLNMHGESGLHCACLHDRAHYIRPLLGLGCDPNIQDRRGGNTALHIAVKEQHQKCIESFLNVEDLRLNLSIRNDEGLTPLHIAIRFRNDDLAGKLLKHDKSSALVCNTKDGNNALHMAVLQKNMALIQLILDGQNVGDILITRNAAGHTPLDLAKSLGSKECNEIFNCLSSLYKDILIDANLTIKEEELSSSSTEDEECSEQPESQELVIKEEYVDDEHDDATSDTVHNDSSTDTSFNLEHILNNADKFSKLVVLLNDSNKWKDLAQKSQMQHLLCLWSNAEDMLSYVKKNTSSHRVFATALAQVDKSALQVLKNN